MADEIRKDFANDTHNIHTVRLSAIQGNLASNQTKMNEPANFETYEEDC